MIKLLSLALAFLFLSTPPPLFSEEFPGDDFFGEETFYEGVGGDIIISATRIPTRLVEVPAIATVIHADQIRNMGAKTLDEVLKIIPGLIILKNKELGAGTGGMNIRGIASLQNEKVLFMVDGHRVNRHFSGGALQSYFDMSVKNIKRVEVIRGPGSALHGANAFVASVNVVTIGSGDVEGLEVLQGVGSKGAKHLNLLFGHKFSKLKIGGFFDYLDNDSSELDIGSDVMGASGQTDDWRKKIDLGLKASLGNFSLNSRFLKKEIGATIGVANAINNNSKEMFTDFFVELGHQKAIGEKWHFISTVYFDQYKNRNDWTIFPAATNPFFPADMIGIPEFKNRTFGAEIQVDYQLSSENTLTTGLLYEDQDQFDLISLGNFDPLTFGPLGSVQLIAPFNRNIGRTVFAFYLQDVWEMTPEIEGTLGVRYDRYSDFGDTVNPRLGLVWSFLQDANIKLLYGTAFRAPAFAELYTENNPVQGNNPGLDPEKVQTYEASIAYFPKNITTSLTFFHSEFKEIIQLAPSTPPLVSAQNIGKQKVSGIELSGKIYLGTVNMVYANYTWQDPEDEKTGKQIPESSRHYGNVGLNWEFTQYLNLNSNLLVVGRRSRSATDTRTALGGYEVLDLTLIIKNFYKTTQVRAHINNLFDETYADPSPATAPFQLSDFPRQGINFMFDVSMKFQ